ncbi:TonB family protein [Algoriphagus sp. 4150]|uniref:energy transducer TonB n=1 Tax=Algoriphagus sp. 4150 TaxID=2817756 RepID=UPI00285FE34F|nr:TonB family protein [Algoriphagus sp. 4150]MDR7130168.1 TonB family protein [Algoriphagus sp. 4150]
MKNKIEITENVYLTPMDIEKQKDFDSVLQNYKARKAGSWNWRNPAIWISLAFVSISITGLLIFTKVNQPLSNKLAVSETIDHPNKDIINHPSEENNVEESELISDSAIVDSESNSSLDSVPVEKTEIPENVQPQKDDEYARTEPPLIVDLEPIDLNIEEITPPSEKPKEVPKVALSVPEEAENNLIESNITFEDAHPIDGFESLYTWFASNITYPEEHRKDKIEGAVKVSFLVEKDSSISEIKVTQSLGVAFDREAVRLIEHMPKWAPATRGGIPISRTLVFPISFKVERR